jgi:hypothetical protein
MMEMQGFVLPIPLDAVLPQTLDEWAVAADKLQDDLVRSRFHDLLWVRKYQRPDLHCVASQGGSGSLPVKVSNRV